MQIAGHKLTKKVTAVKIDGLGEVTFSGPTLGQVLQSDAAASVGSSEQERADLFANVLVGAVTAREDLSFENLTSLQQEQLASALAWILGAAAEFTTQDPQLQPSLRLRKAHAEHWATMFKGLAGELSKVMPPLPDLAWIRERIPDFAKTIQSIRASSAVASFAEATQGFSSQPAKQRVPSSIISACDERRRRTGAERADESDLVDYAYIGELIQIICRKDNWRDCFRSVFSDLGEAQVFIQKMATLRQEVMHFRPLSNDEFLYLTAASTWILAKVRKADEN